MSLHEDEVFQEFFSEKKKPKKKRKKKRSTDVFITLNLNEKFSSMSQEQKERFRDFAKDLFDKKDILLYFEDRDSPGNPLANMDNVQIDWKPEVGPQKGRLHLHALVAIEHHGFLTFKANELRDAARNLFGHSVYLQCPVSSNQRVRWENYLNKGVQEKD